jgi:Bacterial pre-peptidase C-terminal domain
MRQIRLWAIAPIALLAAVSSKSVAGFPVANSDAVLAADRSSLMATEFPQNSPDPVRGVDRVFAQGTPTPPPSGQPSPVVTPPASPSPAAGPSKIILEQKGELTPAKSAVLPSDGSLYDEYTFEGNQGQTVVVAVESTDFDTYLAIFNSQGELLAENDDVTQQNSNSELTLTLSASGRYRVIVNAYEPPPKGRGKYNLTVRETVKN